MKPDGVLSLLSEASFLLQRDAKPCPRWRYGIGDCDLPDCDECRVLRCVGKLDALTEGKVAYATAQKRICPVCALDPDGPNEGDCTVDNCVYPKCPLRIIEYEMWFLKQEERWQRLANWFLKLVGKRTERKER